MRWTLLVLMLVVLGACAETEPAATPFEGETPAPTEPSAEPMEAPMEEPVPDPTEPPDLNCGDIEHRRFTVRHDVADPDPHDFDGNKDGVGCES